MPRLISVDALEKAMQDNGIYPVVVRKALEYALSVAPDPVVRCENCKYYRRTAPPGGLCYLHTEPCTNERGYKGEAVCVEADDFCSYGERKEVIDDGNQQENA